MNPKNPFELVCVYHMYTIYFVSKRYKATDRFKVICLN